MESEHKPPAEVTAVKYDTFDESSDDEQTSDPNCFGWLAVWFACCCCTGTQQEFNEALAAVTNEGYIKRHGTLEAAWDAADASRDAAQEQQLAPAPVRVSRSGTVTVMDHAFGGVPRWHR